jgi:hypothetical protein
MQIAKAVVCAMGSVSLLALAGCGGGKDFVEAPEAVPVVPVSLVINSLKCGLAGAVSADRLDRSGLARSKAKVTLSVNVVQSRTANGDIAVGIPISTGTVTPKLSGSVDQTLTRNTTLEFAIDLATSDPAICRQTGAANRDAGFSLWLGQVVAGINLAVAGPPKASISKYTYESDFVLKKTGTAGAEITIVPVKASASASGSRSDIQNLKVVIGAVHLGPHGKLEDNGKPFDVDPNK